MIGRILGLAVALTLIATPALAIDDVTVAELDALPLNYQNEEVQLVGEIVGDYALQATQVWIQVNDDAYVHTPLAEAGPAGTNAGIGVLIDRQDFGDGWGTPGGYGVRGPVVRVTGVFRYNHGAEMGETYIEATGIELLEPHRAIENAASVTPAIVGLVLAGAGVAVNWVTRRRRVT